MAICRRLCDLLSFSSPSSTLCFIQHHGTLSSLILLTIAVLVDLFLCLFVSEHQKTNSFRSLTFYVSIYAFLFSALYSIASVDCPRCFISAVLLSVLGSTGVRDQMPCPCLEQLGPTIRAVSYSGDPDDYCQTPYHLDSFDHLEHFQHILPRKCTCICLPSCSTCSIVLHSGDCHSTYNDNSNSFLPLAQQFPLSQQQQQARSQPETVTKNGSTPILCALNTDSASAAGAHITTAPAGAVGAYGADVVPSISATVDTQQRYLGHNECQKNANYNNERNNNNKNSPVNSNYSRDGHSQFVVDIWASSTRGASGSNVVGIVTKTLVSSLTPSSIANALQRQQHDSEGDQSNVYVVHDAVELEPRAADFDLALLDRFSSANVSHASGTNTYTGKSLLLLPPPTPNMPESTRTTKTILPLPLPPPEQAPSIVLQSTARAITLTPGKPTITPTTQPNDRVGEGHLLASGGELSVGSRNSTDIQCQTVVTKERDTVSKLADAIQPAVLPAAQDPLLSSYHTNAVIELVTQTTIGQQKSSLASSSKNISVINDRGAANTPLSYKGNRSTITGINGNITFGINSAAEGNPVTVFSSLDTANS